jgi:hypothetical protein
LITFAGLACGFANGSLDGLGEDVPDTGCVLAQDVRVDAQGHGGVGVAKAGGYDVDGDSDEKQRGGVQVAQIVQAGMGEWGGRGSE